VNLLLGALLMAGTPAYVLLQPLAILRWRSGWRTAALAPLLLTVPALAFSLFALTQGSNLWPLTLIFAAIIGAVYLGLLFLLHLRFA
jgi:hypothetical protein